MSDEDKEYIEEALSKCIEGDSTVYTIMTKRLLGIINKATNNNPFGFMLEKSDILAYDGENEAYDISNIDRDTLTALLTIIL